MRLPTIAPATRCARALRHVALPVARWSALAAALALAPLRGLEYGADQAHAAGAHARAAQFYRAAYPLTSGRWRRELAGKAYRCAREEGDRAAEVAAALAILEHDRAVSFGEDDAELARAIVRHFPPEALVPPLPPGARSAARVDALRALWQRACRRIWDVARVREEDRLAACFSEFADGGYCSSPDRLPDGTLRKLLDVADDPAVNPWARGQAAFAAGGRLETVGFHPAALALFREAARFLVSAYPVVTGMSNDGGWDPECDLVRRALAAVERLDPGTSQPGRGGLRLRVDGNGPALPHEAAPSLLLWDRRIEDPRDTEWFADLGHRPRMDGKPEVVLDVMDGRYRLALGRPILPGWPRWTSRRLELVEFDAPGLPAEVEIRGGVLDLPTIRARRIAEIGLLAPADDASVDGRYALFRCSALPGAAFYRFRLGHGCETIRVGTGLAFDLPTNPGWAVALNSAEPQLMPANRTGGPSPSLTADALAMPGECEWAVEAFDAAGRCIGRSRVGKVWFDKPGAPLAHPPWACRQEPEDR